jgi:hypothetical protein
VIRRIRIAWLRWCRDAALEELQLFQARFDVGPLYLVNVMRHANHLNSRIAALEA